MRRAAVEPAVVLPANPTEVVPGVVLSKVTLAATTSDDRRRRRYEWTLVYRVVIEGTSPDRDLLSRFGGALHAGRAAMEAPLRDLLGRGAYTSTGLLGSLPGWDGPNRLLCSVSARGQREERPSAFPKTALDGLATLRLRDPSFKLDPSLLYTQALEALRVGWAQARTVEDAERLRDATRTLLRESVARVQRAAIESVDYAAQVEALRLRAVTAARAAVGAQAEALRGLGTPEGREAAEQLAAVVATWEGPGLLASHTTEAAIAKAVP